MKRSILIVMMVASVVMVGCSHNVATPQAPCDPAPIAQPAKQQDKFDEAGGMFADGSRYVWNESLKAYEWTKETIEKFNAEYDQKKRDELYNSAKYKTEELYKAMKEAVKK